MSRTQSDQPLAPPHKTGPELAEAERAAAELLAPLRAEIDALDQELLELLLRRFGIVRKVAEIKSAHGIPAVLPDRVEAVREGAAKRGAAAGLDPEMMRALYTILIEASCREEDRLFDMVKKNAPATKMPLDGDGRECKES